MTIVKAERFTGKTVLITGGAGGLGRAVAAGFAAEGARVSTVDPNGGDHEVSVTDRDALDGVCAALGRVDVLVCLAGGSLGTPRDLDAIEPAHVDLVVDVNVKGTLYACQAALPYLRRSCGAIVACGSIGGRQPSPVTGAAYAAAKAAVGGLVRKLARELGPDGVRVNAVAPGLFLTERLAGMFAAMEDGERDEVLSAIPLRRLPEVEEIVEPVLFLAGAGASYVTGAMLDVNGGRFMGL